MKCDKCGKTIDSDALTCPFCNAELRSPEEEIEVLGEENNVVEEKKETSTSFGEKKSFNNKKGEKSKKNTKKSNKNTKKEKKEEKPVESSEEKQEEIDKIDEKEDIVDDIKEKNNSKEVLEELKEESVEEINETSTEEVEKKDKEKTSEESNQPVIENGETIDISALGIQDVDPFEDVSIEVDSQPQIVESEEATSEPVVVQETVEEVADDKQADDTEKYEPFVDSEDVVPLPPKKTLLYRIKDFYHSWFEGYEKAPEIKVDDRETRLTLEKIYEKSSKEAAAKPISANDVSIVWLGCFVLAFILFFILTTISFIIDIIVGEHNNNSLLTMIVPVFQIGLPVFLITFGWLIGIVYSYIKRRTNRNK